MFNLPLKATKSNFASLQKRCTSIEYMERSNFHECRSKVEEKAEDVVHFYLKGFWFTRKFLCYGQWNFSTKNTMYMKVEYVQSGKIEGIGV